MLLQMRGSKHGTYPELDTHESQSLCCSSYRYMQKALCQLLSTIRCYPVFTNHSYSGLKKLSFRALKQLKFLCLQVIKTGQNNWNTFFKCPIFNNKQNQAQAYEMSQKILLFNAVTSSTAREQGEAEV